jgi:outer membrane lipoprotein-sorting protein
MVYSVSIFLILLFTIPHSVSSQGNKEQALKNHYLNVCQINYESGGYHPLFKWNRDIKYTIEGNKSSKWDNKILRWMSKIKSKFPFRIVYVSEREEADLIIFIGDSYLYYTQFFNSIRILNLPNQYFSYKLDKEKNLDYVHFCVNVKVLEGNNRARYHIQRYLLKSFGMAGSSNTRKTIFAEYYYLRRWQNVAIKWSKKDLMTLKIHYNENLKSGMRRDEVKEVVKSLKLDL